MSEHTEQVTLIQWFDMHHWKYRRRLFAIPNGTFCNPITKKNMVLEGLRKGVSDLCLPVPIAPYHGLYIELKDIDGKGPTPEQRDWIAFFKEQGYAALVCYGFYEASQSINAYLSGRLN